MNENKVSITGIVFTIAVTIGFIWAAAQWLHRNANPDKLTVERMQANERTAFSNLKLISQAQKKYKETDWDKDGKKTYVMYFVHLWRSVTTTGEPIKVDFIPKRLGFAMDAARAIDGYYFVDLHDRVWQGNTKSLDYEKEWAVLAVPVSNGPGGLLNFLADQSGNIFVNSAKYVPLQYPENLAASGWKKIETIQQLIELQHNTKSQIML
jgi:hypothetical protein